MIVDHDELWDVKGLIVYNSHHKYKAVSYEEAILLKNKLNQNIGLQYLLDTNGKKNLESCSYVYCINCKFAEPDGQSDDWKCRAYKKEVRNHLAYAILSDRCIEHNSKNSCLKYKATWFYTVTSFLVNLIGKGK